jgi:hypothetical protein
MRSSLITILVSAAALCWFSSSAIAEEPATEPCGTTLSLLLHQKSKGTTLAIGAEPISPGEGYATISYSIGTPAQRKRLADWIKLPRSIVAANLRQFGRNLRRNAQDQGERLWHAGQ